MEVKVSYAPSANAPPPPPQYSQYPQNPQYPQYPPNYTPASTYPGPNVHSNYPMPIQTPPSGGWFARNHKNKPQSNSAGAAALIFVSGGMNIAFGVGPFPVAYLLSTNFRISWFIGAIIGALFGAVLCNRLHKKIFYLFSSVLVIIGGILFVSLKTDEDALTAARYLDGFANGFVLVPTLVMVGEEGVKGMRGMLASSIEAMCFTLGISLQLIIYGVWLDVGSSFVPIQIQGALSIVYGLMSAIFSFLLVIESPIFFLARGDEQQALDSLRRLQRPFIVTTETYEQFEEHKRYIAVNKELSFGQSAAAGLPALFKLCLYRGLLAITYSSLLNFGFLITALTTNGLGNSWPYFYGTLRFLGCFVSVFMLDSGGRKTPMLFGMIFSAGMAIGVGIILVEPIYGSISAVPYLLLVFQFFAGVSIASSSAYLSEAFPLAIKPYYIAISFIVEMLVQIIICAIKGPDLGTFFTTAGALMAAFFIFGLLFMPETKQTTLREAQEKFRKFK